MKTIFFSLAINFVVEEDQYVITPKLRRTYSLWSYWPLVFYIREKDQVFCSHYSIMLLLFSWRKRKVKTMGVKIVHRDSYSIQTVDDR